jgi:Putative 2OG-Fe(II) oxygenase
MQTRSLGPADRLAVCDSHLARDPANTTAKFTKAMTLASLGRGAEARDLISLDRLIEIQTLTPPPGYADDQSFRDALAQEIRANPTLSPDPRLMSTRGGLHTRLLRQEGAVAIESLLTRIRQEVDAYELRLIESGDAFAIGRPQKVRLAAWAVVHGRAGRQKAHRHPNGWLSGSYYVAAPRPDGEDAFRGPLIMGAVDPDDCDVDPPWGTRQIEPVPGRLVLFPSYVPHATEASGVDGARICVAFDVVPVHDSAPAHVGMS